jgi:exosome complex component RRP4
MSDISYTPRVGDIVIGKVEKITATGWSVNISSLYLAQLEASNLLCKPFDPNKDVLPRVLNMGDRIVAKVVHCDEMQNVLLDVGVPGLGKITRGQTVQIKHTRLLFIGGKKDPITRAIIAIKKETGCHIIAGLNGVVLITGKNPADEELAKKAICRINEEPYSDDLPDRILQMLKEEKLRSVQSHTR